jgi:CheY-like chemotaxis protein
MENTFLRIPLGMPRILAVDDSVDDLLFLEEFFRQHHYSFETASSGSLALVKLKNEFFDLVISDYQMVDGDGLWLLSELKQLNLSTTFILASSETKYAADHYLALGADAFIPKPISWDQLKLCIDQLLLLAHRSQK